MNWSYNWYSPRKDLDVAELSDQMTRLFLTGFIGDKALKSERLETGRESHLDRTVSIWQH